MRQSARGARQVHEGCKVRAGLNGHAEKAGLAERLPQPIDERVQVTRVVGCGDDRAAAGSGSRDCPIGIADPIAGIELEGGLVFGQRHRPRGLARAMAAFIRADAVAARTIGLDIPPAIILVGRAGGEVPAWIACAEPASGGRHGVRGGIGAVALRGGGLDGQKRGQQA